MELSATVVRKNIKLTEPYLVELFDRVDICLEVSTATGLLQRFLVQSYRPDDGHGVGIRNVGVYKLFYAVACPRGLCLVGRVGLYLRLNTVFVRHSHSSAFHVLCFT